MGSYYTTYVGPYLEVPAAVQTITSEPKTVCSSGNKKHKVSFGMKFCPQCGASTKEEITTQDMSAVVDLYDICGAEEEVWNPASIREHVWQKDKPNIWVSNSSQYGLRLDGDGEGVTIDFGSAEFAEQVARETDEFYVNIQWIIEQIIADYGVTPVVKYGIVPYRN